MSKLTRRSTSPINFRDLGLQEGLNIKPGLVYRTADWSLMQDQVHDQLLQDHKIKSYIDFRTHHEVGLQGAHDRLHPKGVRWHHYPIDPKVDDFIRILRPEAKDWIELYRNLLEKHSALWMGFLEKLCEVELPVMYGCSLGKDRTGIATSVFLLALEVEPVHIQNDYVKTTQMLLPHADMFEFMWKEFDRERDDFINHFFLAHPDIMQDFVVEAENKLEQIGVTPALRRRLRERFLRQS